MRRSSRPQRVSASVPCRSPPSRPATRRSCSPRLTVARRGSRARCAATPPRTAAPAPGGPNTTGRPASRPDLELLAGAVLGDGVELVVLLAGVHPVLELDDAGLGEPLAQPAVGRIEEAELLAVRHDLREQHLLEHLLR